MRNQTLFFVSHLHVIYIHTHLMVDFDNISNHTKVIVSVFQFHASSLIRLVMSDVFIHLLFFFFFFDNCKNISLEKKYHEAII